MSELTTALIVTRLQNAAKFEVSCGTLNPNRFGLLEDAAELIQKLEAEKNDLDYKLVGVMHFVDKWLEGAETQADEVNRASLMREKTLQIVEKLQAENERLRSERDAAVADAAAANNLLKLIYDHLRDYRGMSENQPPRIQSY